MAHNCMAKSQIHISRPDIGSAPSTKAMRLYGAAIGVRFGSKFSLPFLTSFTHIYADTFLKGEFASLRISVFGACELLCIASINRSAAESTLRLCCAI